MTNTKKVTKKSTKTTKTKVEIQENTEKEDKKEPEVKWKPVAKEENKVNGNFFAKMVDFFHF